LTEPYLLVQLSDLHGGGTWGGPDPIAALERAVASVLALPQLPDAVVVTGDLTDAGLDAEYEAVRSALEPLGSVHVLPGNHDDRDALRRAFGLAGDPGAPVHYATDLGPLRLVALDTTRPGEDGGELDRERLDWLDAELSAAPGRPTLLAMHHPPFPTGIPALDVIGIPAADRAALADVVRRHPQVRRIVAGHVHRAISAEVGGCVAFSAPSTYVQLRLDFATTEIEVGGDPAGFAVHALLDGELVSHVQPLP